MPSLIKLFKRNLYGVAHSLKLGSFGSVITSVQGDVGPGDRTPTEDDDDVQFRLPDDSDYARIKVLDVRSIDTNVFGTYIVDHEITTSTMPSSPSQDDYALVTSDNGSYLTNELYRYKDAAWKKVPLEHGKQLLIRKAGGLTGYVNHTLYVYNATSSVWTEVGVVGAIGTPTDGNFGGVRGNVSGLTVDDLVVVAFDKHEDLLGQVQYGVTKRRKSVVAFSDTGTVVVDTIPAGYHVSSIFIVVEESFNGAGDTTLIRHDDGTTVTDLATLDDTELVAGEVYEFSVENEFAADLDIVTVNTFSSSTVGSFEVIVEYRGTN